MSARGSTRFFQCAVFAIAAWGGSAQAAPLNIVPSLPDIQFNAVTVDYVAATEALTVTLNNPNGLLDVDSTGNDYSVTAVPAPQAVINATVDNAGVLSGGTFSLTGLADTNGDLTNDVTGLLLSGSLLDLGFSGDTIELLVSGVSGGLTPLFSSPLGIILTATGLQGAGGWNDFNSQGASAINITTPAVPLPAPIALLLAGGAILGLRSMRSTGRYC